MYMPLGVWFRVPPGPTRCCSVRCPFGHVYSYGLAFLEHFTRVSEHGHDAPHPNHCQIPTIPPRVVGENNWPNTGIAARVSPVLAHKCGHHASSYLPYGHFITCILHAHQNVSEYSTKQMQNPCTRTNQTTQLYQPSPRNTV